MKVRVKRPLCQIHFFFFFWVSLPVSYQGSDTVYYNVSEYITTCPVCKFFDKSVLETPSDFPEQNDRKTFRVRFPEHDNRKVSLEIPGLLQPCTTLFRNLNKFCIEY